MRAAKRVRSHGRALCASKAKIQEPNVSRSLDEDVRGLDIAVDDRSAMQFAQQHCQVVTDSRGLRVRKTPALDALREALAVEERKIGDVGTPVILAVVAEDLDPDSFRQIVPELGRVRAALVALEIQRFLALKVRVVYLVNTSKRPLADETDYHVVTYGFARQR